MWDMKEVAQRGIAGIGLALTLAACAPSDSTTGGLTGLTVNGEGALVMVAAWCGAAPDGVEVLHDTAEGLRDQANIEAPPLNGKTVSLNLDEKPDGWTLKKGSLNFQDGQTYTVRPYISKTHTTLFGVSFTHQTREKIPRDRIMIQDYANGVTRDVLLTKEEFSTRTQYYC
jgi:hypothetical protein